MGLKKKFKNALQHCNFATLHQFRSTFFRVIFNAGILTTPNVPAYSLLSKIPRRGSFI